jgi:maltooligosyltrehalose trehalohydrolase
VGHDANALVARWRLADGETLAIALNLTSDTLPFEKRPDGMVIFETPDRARDSVDADQLPGYACLAWLTGDVNTFALQHDARLYQPGGSAA